MKLSQGSLAKEFGWATHRNVSAIERDHELPSLEYVDYLSQLSGFQPRWILFGDVAKVRKGNPVMNQWLELFLNTPEDRRADLLEFARAASKLLDKKNKAGS